MRRRRSYSPEPDGSQENPKVELKQLQGRGPDQLGKLPHQEWALVMAADFGRLRPEVCQAMV